MARVKAHDLFRLGRRLSKLAEDAMRPEGSPKTPPGVQLILMEVHAQPGSTIGELAARTGLPQSYVSESVARLRQQGAFKTWPDPADGRRTLVGLGQDVPRAVARAGATDVDQVLIDALGSGSADTDRALIAALEALAARLNP